MSLLEPDIFLHLNAFQKFINARGNRFLLKENIPNYEIIARVLLITPEMT